MKHSQKKVRVPNEKRNPDIFCICVIKEKCLVFPKLHILSVMTLTLFARILGESTYLSKYAQKG